MIVRLLRRVEPGSPHSLPRSPLRWQSTDPLRRSGADDLPFPVSSEREMTSSVSTSGMPVNVGRWCRSWA